MKNGLLSVWEFRREGLSSQQMFFWEALEVIIMVTALSWLFKTYIFQGYMVSDQAMLPTLREGDAVLVDRCFFDHQGDKRRPALQSMDLVLYQDDSGQMLARRVLACAGDTVETRNGRTLVNRRPVYEPYLETGRGIKTENIKPMVVPEDHIYLLSDNRYNREDSRTWGCVPLEKVSGRLLLCYWPWMSWGVYL